MDQDFDVLIGEWHELADQRPEVIEGRFASDGKALLEQVLSNAMGSTPFWEFSSPSEFAQYVINLRENEKAWSRHLGEVILASQSLLDQGNPDAAEKIFDEFEAKCPWQMFVDIARTQRANTLGDRGAGAA
ncbi:hypothetical protein [Propionivibrio sp.]|uniref:hypothetical protein n=1 Tax=Propionivibrio sp. TaxID=2212460 RepID=UPI0039E38934